MKLFLLTFALLISLSSCSEKAQTIIPGTTMPETSIMYTDSTADTDTDSISEAAPAESTLSVPAAVVSEAVDKQSKQYTAVLEEQDNARIPQIVCIKHTDTGMRTELPSLEIYNRLLAESPRTSPFLSIDFTACDWLDTERLKVDFTIKTGVSYYPRTTTGWYIWDVSSGALTECIYESVSDAEDVPELSQSDIAEMIDKNLDILMTDSEGLYSEAEFISAHPEAFGEIVALGEAALPYLKKVSDGVAVYGINTESYRCFLAMAAANAIQPTLYEECILSPDGSVAILAEVSSFFTLKDPFSGIIYDVSIIDAKSGVLLIAPGNRIFLENTEFNWFAGHRYIIFEENYRHYYTVLELFDTECALHYRLPDTKALEDYLGEPLTYYDPTVGIILNCQHFSVAEWLNDSSVKITISLSSNAGGYIEAGWYIFNLDEQQITSAQFRLVNSAQE